MLLPESPVASAHARLPPPAVVGSAIDAAGPAEDAMSNTSINTGDARADRGSADKPVPTRTTSTSEDVNASATALAVGTGVDVTSGVPAGEDVDDSERVASGVA